MVEYLLGEIKLFNDVSIWTKIFTIGKIFIDGTLQLIEHALSKDKNSLTLSASENHFVELDCLNTIRLTKKGRSIIDSEQVELPKSETNIEVRLQIILFQVKSLSLISTKTKDPQSTKQLYL